LKIFLLDMPASTKGCL